MTPDTRAIFMRLMHGEVIPKCETNPGVANRLAKEASIEIIFLPSPYKTHAGTNHKIQFLRKKETIT